MSKKVLVVYYTQTGQLEKIIDSFLAPFTAAGVSIERHQVVPKKNYGFPWSAETFFDEMPPSVLGETVAVAPLQFSESKYDLVVFGWQPWFLSPSVPTASVLKDPAFRTIIKNTPVITITGCRNMWLNAFDKLRPLLKDAGARLVGNIALVDRHANLVSLVTILYWQLYGKKDRLYNIFPKPGVSEEDIAGTAVFGATALKHLQESNFENLQDEMIAQKAVFVKWNLMFIENTGRKLFGVWARIIGPKKNRKPWLVLFRYYLLIALFIVSPVVVGIYGLFFKPFLSKSINRKKHYYLDLN